MLASLRRARPCGIRSCSAAAVTRRYHATLAAVASDDGGPAKRARIGKGTFTDIESKPTLARLFVGAVAGEAVLRGGIGRTSRPKSTRRSTVWADAALAVLPGQAAAHVSVAQRSVHGSHRLALTITLLWDSRSRSRQDRRSPSRALSAEEAQRAVWVRRCVSSEGGRLHGERLRSGRRHESADRQCDCRLPAYSDVLPAFRIYSPSQECSGPHGLGHFRSGTFHSQAITELSKRVCGTAAGSTRGRADVAGACGTKWAAHCETGPRRSEWLAALDDFRNWLIREAA